MTDSTIDGKYLCWIDRWPEGNTIHSIPQDGFRGTTHYNVETAAYPLGTKCRVYHDNALSKGQPGWSTFIYLQAATANATTAVATRSIVTPGHDDNVYKVTNNSTSTGLKATGNVLTALALGPITNNYHGFYFCGGVLPADMVTSGTTYVLDSTVETDGSLAVGHAMTIKASGQFKLTAFTNTGGQIACAWSGAADT